MAFRGRGLVGVAKGRQVDLGSDLVVSPTLLGQGGTLGLDRLDSRGLGATLALEACHSINHPRDRLLWCFQSRILY